MNTKSIALSHYLPKSIKKPAKIQKNPKKFQRNFKKTFKNPKKSKNAEGVKDRVKAWGIGPPLFFGFFWIFEGFFGICASSITKHWANE